MLSSQSPTETSMPSESLIAFVSRSFRRGAIRSCARKASMTSMPITIKNLFQNMPLLYSEKARYPSAKRFSGGMNISIASTIDNPVDFPLATDIL